MNIVTGNPLQNGQLIRLLRDIASGDVKKTSNIREICSFAADRIYELDERIAIMTEEFTERSVKNENNDSDTVR